MALSVIVINLSRSKQSQAVPYFIKNAIDGNFGKFLGLNRINVQVQRF